jgi:hypothetical protein
MVKAIQIRETDYEGVTEITADGWDGRILRMSHAVLVKWGESRHVPFSAGVYLLFADHFDRVTHGNALYVGQTGTIAQRLKQHVAGKDFWSVVMIFVSGDDWMNVAYTPNIERQFIAWAKLANRYDVRNGDSGRTEHLGQDDTERLHTFLAGVRPVLRLAGIDVFEPNLDGQFRYKAPRLGSAEVSQIKIVSPLPNPIVKILAGSRIGLLDDALVRQANLAGVTYDLNERLHIFQQDVEVALVPSIVSLKLLGSSLRRWTSTAGISLDAALKAPEE